MHREPRADGKAPGQDFLLTSDYEGAHENSVDVGYGQSLWSGHAAALEVVRASPGVSTRFAAAWIAKSTGVVHVASYDVTEAQKVGNSPLPWPTSGRRWLARLGYDASCSAVSGSTSCAWFTWTDGYGSSAWVNWVPVGVGATLGTTRYFAGTDGSGDIGVFYRGGSVRAQLLAYISRDRKHVMYALLDSLGHAITQVTLKNITDPCYDAYQTAVVWSPREERFLVVWAENSSGICGPIPNGRIWSRWVDGLGIALQDAPQPLGYCEGNPQTPTCISGKQAGGVSMQTQGLASAGLVQKVDGGAVARPDAAVKPKDGAVESDLAGGGTRTSNCSCKGFFVAASHTYSFGTATDRYRVHQYGWHARLNGAGVLANNPDYLDSRCSVFCPMDHRWPSAAPYALAQNKSVTSSEMRYLVHDSLQTQLEGTIHEDGLVMPQALRTTPDATLIGTLSSTKQDIALPSTLGLTISDGGTGGCP